MLRCMICCLFVVHFQYAFTVKEESDVMIALMQEDTRKEKERGVENLTIGYFVMKVTIEWRRCELWKYKFKWRYDRRSGNCKLNRIKKILRLQRARARIPLNHGLESRRLNCNYHQKVKNKNGKLSRPPFLNSHHLHIVSFLSRVEMNSTTWLVPNVWIFIAQFVEHCSANAEAMGSNPVEVPICFSLIAIS